MREKRNCEGLFPKSKFKHFYGTMEINECPVSYITPWSQLLISEYFNLIRLKSIGIQSDIDDYCAKEIEGLLLIKDTINQIEKEIQDKNKWLQKH